MNSGDGSHRNGTASGSSWLSIPHSSLLLVAATHYNADEDEPPAARASGGGRCGPVTEMAKKAHRKRILTRSFMSFMDNDLTTAAAAVSYFSMLTLFPTLLLLLTIGNGLLGQATVE